MRRPEVEILEDDLDDNALLTRWELELPIDLTREDLDDDDEDDGLGFRTLYEHPEAILRPSRRPYAA
jgi:hypothetical protein